MSGRPGDLNEKQKEKLAKFKENLKDVLAPKHDDMLLLKFLRARRFDLKKAEQMFRKDLEWRKENKVDTILEWYNIPDVFVKYWAGGVTGMDKEGHILYVADVGNLDPKGIMYSAKVSDILKTNIYYNEELGQQQDQMSLEKYGRRIEGVTAVIDLEKLGIHHLWKPGVDALQKVAVIEEQHYPELIHRLFIVNAPKIFPLAYSLIKPFLREDTRKKIQVLGSGWKEELLKYIDADQLPAHWGGTLTDPDGNPKCETLVKPGGKVPESFYLKDREPPHTLTMKEVSRGGTVELKHEIKKPDSVLRYEFQTDVSDIKFGIDRVDENGKKTPIMKLEKYNSHMVPENGELLITEPGLYLAKFDNSSWTKTKKLSYWLELLEPTDAEPEFREMTDDFATIDVSD
ncbi:SEC14-like protein 2 [Diadema antillarum]|uniref:SEC14-like protein 2 n=1 Tax=Diadema antillarum TaxID=105358 RepID=UPI003A8BB8AF